MFLLSFVLNWCIWFVVSEAGYEFDKKKLLEYNHMSFGGPPATVESDEEANELLRHIEEESAIGNKKP